MAPRLSASQLIGCASRTLRAHYLRVRRQKSHGRNRCVARFLSANTQVAFISALLQPWAGELFLRYDACAVRTLRLLGDFIAM